MKSNLKTTGLSESDALTLAKKFQPVLYFHKDETYFPTKVEGYSIDWSKVTLENKDATIDTNGYKGNTSLDQSVPYYVSILENSDGTCRISYLFHYAFNDKGPTLEVKAKLVGVGIKESVTVGNYGFGVHWGDVEHIEVTLNKGYGSIKNVLYAFHEWDKTYTDFEVENSTHPVVYVAKGSHASYKSDGDQDYSTYWDEKKTKTVVVTKVTVYDTYGKFVDHPPSSKSAGLRWYTTNLRLLKLNGNKVSSANMSTAEEYMGFKYKGKLGPQYTNTNISGLKSAIGYNTFMPALKAVSTSAYNTVKDGFDDAANDAYLECTASGSFYGRGFW